ncbi:hypothetical protein [Idiomarina sp. UBA1919]|uniref:hypothetical protein n=1 Tax=Idiomarina sp. UBA1919 TaxID=1946640 RepID=UPI00257DD93A|nr:hypothetical protein [Idiomarina sp. UBA1919]|tara:strand:+ start:424 stop:777 length:354 start_codon:yes stop_codon:yes gene_type:complete
MACIRRRYHYAKIYIDDEVPELIGKSLVGSQLDVLLKNGDFERRPFGGFLRDPEQLLQPVKILNVEAYADGGYFTGDWVELSPNALLLGELIEGRTFIVIKDRLPVAWCDYPIGKKS